MLYNTSEGNKKIAIAVSQMWKQKLGAKVTLANQEWKTYLSSRSQQNFQLARGVWCGGYNEASAFFILLHSRSGVNDGKFTSVLLDELLEQARTVADTQPLYTEIEQIIADEVPIISVFHLADNFMLDTDLGGWPVQVPCIRIKRNEINILRTTRQLNCTMTRGKTCADSIRADKLQHIRLKTTDSQKSGPSS